MLFDAMHRLREGPCLENRMPVARHETRCVSCVTCIVCRGAGFASGGLQTAGQRATRPCAALYFRALLSVDDSS